MGENQRRIAAEQQDFTRGNVQMLPGELQGYVFILMGGLPTLQQNLNAKLRKTGLQPGGQRARVAEPWMQVVRGKAEGLVPAGSLGHRKTWVTICPGLCHRHFAGPDVDGSPPAS